MSMTGLILLASLALHQPQDAQTRNDKLPKLEDVRIAGIGLGMNEAQVVNVLGLPDEMQDAGGRPITSIADAKSANATWRKQLLPEIDEALSVVALYVNFDDNSVSEIYLYSRKGIPVEWKTSSNIVTPLDFVPESGDYLSFASDNFSSLALMYPMQASRYYLDNHLNFNISTRIWSETIEDEAGIEVRVRPRRAYVTSVVLSTDDIYERIYKAHQRQPYGTRITKRQAERDVELKIEDPTYNVVFENKRASVTRNDQEQILSSRATGIIKSNSKSDTRLKIRLIQYLDDEIYFVKVFEIGLLSAGGSMPYGITIEWDGNPKGEVSYRLEIQPLEDS